MMEISKMIKTKSATSLWRALLVFGYSLVP